MFRRGFEGLWPVQIGEIAKRNDSLSIQKLALAPNFGVNDISVNRKVEVIGGEFIDIDADRIFIVGRVDALEPGPHITFFCLWALQAKFEGGIGSAVNED